MVKLSLKYQQVLPFISADEISIFEREASLHLNNIYNRKGRGNDFLGWVDLPGSLDEDIITRMESDAKRLAEHSDVVVITGIGGSYLGARAVIEALKPAFENGPGPEIVYAGHHLDEQYHAQLLRYLESKDFSVIVISKSGTTTEPAVAFRLLRDKLEARYGKSAVAGRIIAITDASKGALKQLATEHSYPTYDIPDDVGGRYSVLTPVGLLPIAVAGVDIRELIRGAANMSAHLGENNSLMNNQAALYAVLRNILYNKGKTVEILTSYKPSLHYLTEWWKQLFGESEGKEGKGIFPAGVTFTTDLHSMGQYIQDGVRNLFETVIISGDSSGKLAIPEDPDDLDGLNYIAGESMAYVNSMAAKGTMMAHVEGGVPNIEIHIPGVKADTLGELIYFFEMSCAISGYILGVNPFDQPGVEAYKKNMFRLLGKPGS